MSDAGVHIQAVKPEAYEALEKENQTLRAQLATAKAALVEATAELIYLREHGHLGAKWWANESKDVWRDMARAALAKAKPK